MKTLLLLAVFFYSVIVVAQVNSVQTINNTQCKISVQLPAYYTTHVDTLGLIMYSSLTQDSLVGAQLFLYNNYSLDSNDVLNDYMTQLNETDTLKTIAKFMVVQSGGGLIYFQIIANNVTEKSMDIGIRYPDNNTSFISFTRLIMKDRKLIILNIFSQECYLTRLLTSRDQCYNSLISY